MQIFCFNFISHLAMQNSFSTVDIYGNSLKLMNCDVLLVETPFQFR